ncbi:MAG: N-acetylmuramoyl-L-alanine amidase [Sneathiella sp.]|nr:MAG: N-acetylmuramoyl-L-alanine amidase [Sneathiella sp.]
MIWRASPNFDARDADIDTLVLHYTGMPTGGAALDRLTDAAAEVSAHYLVEENGEVYQLVEEDSRAWHAGVSYWRGAANLNARSIGIEIVNPGHEFGYRSFTKAQMASVAVLAVDIVERHGILPRNVVGHSDIAPLRKNDPGELFDWKMLSAKGIGLWFADHLEINPAAVSYSLGMAAGGVTKLRDALTEIGYDGQGGELYDAGLAALITAFQRHWRPARVDAVADAETQAVIYAVRDSARRLTRSSAHLR